MVEQQRRSPGLAGEVSDSRTLLERLRRSAEALERLGDARAPGLPGDASAALLQEAAALHQIRGELSLLLQSWSLIADTSHRLLNLPVDELEAGLRAALCVLGQHIDAQRCYVFLLSEDGNHLVDAYEWCAPGTEPHDLEGFRGTSVQPFTWTARKLGAGETIVITDPANLPPEARAERAVCRKLRVRSYVNAPLSLGGRLIGCLGFDAVGAPRDWTPEELHLVALSADVLVNALERKRRDAMLFREKELEQRAQSLGILAAGLAHEINNPLAYTSGNLEYLRERLPARHGKVPEGMADEYRQVLDEALEGAIRIRRIVTDLRSLAGGDSGEAEPVDLKAVIESTLRMASNQLRHRAQVVRDYPAELPRVRGTTTKLGQVLLNLVINAAQAIPEGHVSENRITVSLRTEADMVVLALSDTGCGIAPDVLPRIFDPFFTTRQVGEGMGMGLAICRNIINAVGGKIFVHSEQGRGTTVEVHLPRAEEAQPQAAELIALHKPGRGRRVLAVDDEPRVLDLLRRLLRDHEVVTASNGREALERLSTDTSFDIILCDLMMPELTGVDVYRYVRENHPGLHERIVFISGGAFTAETKRFLQEVDNPVLTKPFEPVHIRNIVNNAGSGADARV